MTAYDIKDILGDYRTTALVQTLATAITNVGNGVFNVGEGVKTLANSIEKVGEGVIDEMAQRRMQEGERDKKELARILDESNRRLGNH